MNNLPFEIFDNIKKYVIFKPVTTYDIDNAINLWFNHNEKASKIYGHASLWDLSNFDPNYMTRFYNNLMNENWNSLNVLVQNASTVGLLDLKILR